MSRRYQGILLGLVAILILRLSISGEFLNYVKPVMRIWLIVSGVALAALAVALVRQPGGADEHGHDDHHGDDHGTQRLAWLMIVPVAAAFVVAPGSLGAFAASRGAAWTPQAPAASSWPPALLSPIEGAHEVGLNDFNTRAFFDEAQSLADRRVRLVGFVRPGAMPDEFLITRFAVACCAADGVAVSVRALGHDGPVPEVGTWVELEGTWVPNAVDPEWSADDDSKWAAVDVAELSEIPEPREPYEST